MHTYLLENRTYLQPWEPLRDDVFFEIDTVADRLQLMEQKTASGDALHFLLFHSDAVTQRLRLMEHKAANGEASHVLMRDSDEHRG